jgi:hypothetical protein
MFKSRNSSTKPCGYGLKSHPAKVDHQCHTRNEFCIVVSNGGMKRKQRVQKPCD